MASDGTLKFDTSLDTDGLQSGMGKVASVAQQALGVFTGQMMTRAVDALANLGKSALDSVGQLEQNVGGVETLFGNAADAVIASADRAYQTAGMSANDYMSTVTSFSASLLQSLGGNTAEAAKVADMAIIDMADNANKMGTSMDMIQNAYQGFAKQNYTMLDNLKLGYGGTKTEMERLLADAQKLTGVKYDINNLNDVYQAIHAVQEEMGITGTTAKEASSTLEGSMNSAKAAWDNFMNGSGDADQLADAFATAADNIVKNLAEIIPRFAETLPALGSAIIAQIPGLVAAIVPAVISAGQSVLRQIQDTVLGFDFTGAADKAVQMITGFIEGDGLGSLLNTLTSIFTGIVNGISSMLPSLLPALVKLISYVATSLLDQLPALLDCALNLITGLAQGLIDAIPVLVAALPKIIDSLIKFLVSSIPKLIDAAIQLINGLVAALPEIISALIDALPQIIESLVSGLLSCVGQLIVGAIQLVTALVANLPEIIAGLVAAIPQIITAIIDGFINGLGAFVECGGQIIDALWEGIKTVWETLVRWFTEVIPNLISNIGTWFSELPGKVGEWLSVTLGNIVSWGATLWEKAQKIGRDFINGIINFIKTLPQNISNWLKNVISKVTAFASNFGKKAAEAGKLFFTNLINKVKAIPSQMLSIGKNIVSGIWNGITGAAGWLWNQISGFCSNIVNNIKGFFGIHSPSRLMAKEIGRFLPSGISIGFEDAVPKASSQIKNSLNDMVSGLEPPAVPIDVLGQLRGCGVLNNIPLAVQASSAELTARAVSSSPTNKPATATQEPIDYDKLAEAMANVQIQTKVEMDGEPIATATNRRMGRQMTLEKRRV